MPNPWLSDLSSLFPIEAPIDSLDPRPRGAGSADVGVGGGLLGGARLFGPRAGPWGRGEGGKGGGRPGWKLDARDAGNSEME